MCNDDRLMVVLVYLMMNGSLQQSGKFKVSSPGGLVTVGIKFSSYLTGDNYAYQVESIDFDAIAALVPYSSVI